ncbi:MAG: FkbM family methyltransferase [Ignavibacteria bacterium]|nr:FkbM family methyltransferase [Ignavibacteria bacterium]
MFKFFRKPTDENLIVGNMRKLLKDLYLRGFKPKNIVDIGANNGEWSKLAKKIFKNSDFFLIDPLKEMEIDLSDFCKVNPGSKYFLYGVGSKNEKKFLTLGGVNLTGSNLMFEENELLKKVNEQREIQIITLDSLLENGELPLPDFVKVDIQGFELEALKGGEKLFQITEVFIIETNFFEFMKGVPLAHEVIIYMAEKGYVIYDFPGFLRRPFDGALAQMDVCFVKKNGLLRKSNSW